MYTVKHIHYSGFRLLAEATLGILPGVFFVGGENKDSPKASSNMSGKSTLAAGLVWCLYGTDMAGKPVAANVVTIGKKTARVSVTVEQQGGPSVQITRTRYHGTIPTGCGRNMVAIQEAGKPINEGTAEEMQPTLDAMFGNVTLFLAAHVFAFNTGTKPFADATDTEQKRLFDLLIETADLDAALVRAKAKKAGLDALLQKTQGILNTATGRESELREALAELQAQSETDTVLREELRQALFVEQETKKRVVAIAGQVGKRVAELDACIAQSKERTTEYQVRYQNARDIAATESGRIADYEKRMRTIGRAAKQAACPTCGKQVTDAEWKAIADGIQQQINEATEKKEKAIQQSAADAQRLTDEQVLRNTKEQERRNAATEVSAANAAATTAETAAEHARKKLETYTASRQQQETMLTERITEAEKNKQTAEKDIHLIEQEIEVCAFWVEAFGPRGMRAYRLDTITPILNKLAQRYSDALYGDGTTLRYSTQTKTQRGESRDKFEAALYAPVNGDMKRMEKIDSVLSAGQSMRRDIIHTFAMVELAALLGKRSCDILVLDELFVSIDELGMRATMRLLTELNTRVHTILVIEHNDDLRQAFSRTILCTRQNGTTSVIVDAQ